MNEVTNAFNFFDRSLYKLIEFDWKRKIAIERTNQKRNDRPTIRLKFAWDTDRASNPQVCMNHPHSPLLYSYFYLSCTHLLCAHSRPSFAFTIWYEFSINTYIYYFVKCNILTIWWSTSTTYQFQCRTTSLMVFICVSSWCCVENRHVERTSTNKKQPTLANVFICAQSFFSDFLGTCLYFLHL